MTDKERLEVREELAAYAHEAWSGWMEYMFSKCQIDAVSFTGIGQVKVTVPIELYNRWVFQMKTSYADLPEDMKPSDRDEADKMISIALSHI